MAELIHLNNAPITEALIDIQVELPPDIDMIKLDAITSLIANSYPQKQENRRWQASIEFKAGDIPKQNTIDEGPEGYLYRSADNTQVIQAKLHGFTFSKLKPYISWQALRDEAYKLWQLYVTVASPKKITRVALRYINHLEIPLPFESFGDYLTAPPVVPEKLPQLVSSFLNRVVIHEPSMAVVGIITQAMEPLIKPNSVSIILDIDVFKESLFDIDGNEAWETIENLHTFKNQVFFESITEKTVELYK